MAFDWLLIKRESRESLTQYLYAYYPLPSQSFAAEDAEYSERPPKVADDDSGSASFL